MELVLHEQDNGRTVNVPVGSTFSVELNENRTSGYAWSQPDLDGHELALESDDSIPGRAAQVGSSGMRRFVFRAKAAGTGTIRSMYRRPWDAAGPAAAEFKVTIVGSQ